MKSKFNQAIRSPNLDELFATVAIGFSAGDDLCATPFSPTAAQKSECVLQGISTAEIDTFQHLGVGFGVRSGGNDALTEETADSWTIGAVVTPPILDGGLSFTIDYYSIEITSAINQLTAQEVVNDCFSTTNLDHNRVAAIRASTDVLSSSRT